MSRNEVGRHHDLIFANGYVNPELDGDQANFERDFPIILKTNVRWAYVLIRQYVIPLIENGWTPSAQWSLYVNYAMGGGSAILGFRSEADALHVKLALPEIMA